MIFLCSLSAKIIDGNISDPFDVSAGVLQGDVLALFLFVILVDYLMTNPTSGNDSGFVTHSRRSRRHPPQVINDLDVALLESTTLRAQAQLTRTAQEAEDLGLVNSIKFN